jgi:hypothetical protein
MAMPFSQSTFNYNDLNLGTNLPCKQIKIAPQNDNFSLQTN